MRNILDQTKLVRVPLRIEHAILKMEDHLKIPLQLRKTNSTPFTIFSKE